MAIRMVALPECDKCGEIWLPDKRLPDGSPNPARENPRLSKRCGKCKTPRWNWRERPVRTKIRKKAEEVMSAATQPEWIG